ncbi:cytochrome p450 domain-containing protein [Trichoderma breve]|uniref:Cytochrome p450 domain-containing protein n=1 Tax=Trichoderma breve TaxID=2034170 RepID=A0A9W9BHC6_9HYPO|nr:cytochrome p450 domain-containing protein [Trichoderma breve]KAJ4861384.1 cytochrome p450 domain-containing protein [Trichoderma breve]
MLLTAESLLFTLRPGVALVLWVIILGTVYLISIPIYNVWFHPLRKYPGPRLWAATRIPYARMIFSGMSHRKILELHQIYGDVVRVAPDELTYIGGSAWNDIMGHRKRGQGENGKDPVFWKTQQHSVISADRENHTRMRRTLAHGFSTQAMMDQQSLIRGYVDMLISRLRENCADGTRPLEMTSWYNWATFDIIGDLAFGEPFGCLQNSNYHPWVSLLFTRIRTSAMNNVLRRFPFGDKLIQLLISKQARKQFQEYFQLTQEKVKKRLAETNPRSDFMEAMIKKDGDMKFSHAELLDNASLLIIAGSETTATTLSGVTYLLLTHPEVLQKTMDEVRSSFSNEGEIDLLSVQKLGYMMAVLQEALRMYPPVPTAIPRKTQPGGDVICGQYVPANTILGIWQWPMYHNAKNFTLPDSYIPERWLGDARFSSDPQDVFQAFSFGPRNCIGKNLAYAEMRLILARILWNFDISLHPDSKDWLQENMAYTLWQKPDLNIYIKPREIL